MPVAPQRHIAYGAHPLQCFDLHVPDDAASAPVVFLIHGGSFVMGRKEDFEKQARLFCAEGFVAVNLSYRLADAEGLQASGTGQAGRVRIPEQVADVQAAVRLFRRQAKSRGLSDASLFVAGHSAGAILSLLYLLGEGRHEFIRAAGNWAGITDLSLPTALTAGFLMPWQQVQMQFLYDQMCDFSALTGRGGLGSVSAYRLAEEGGGLPVISLFPEHNFVLGIPGEAALGRLQTKRFHTLLRSQQVPEQFRVFGGCDHNFQQEQGDAWAQCIQETAAFFRKLIAPFPPKRRA